MQAPRCGLQGCSQNVQAWEKNTGTLHSLRLALKFLPSTGVLSPIQMVTTDLRLSTCGPMRILAHYGVTRRIRPLWPQFPQQLVTENELRVTRG